jgi:hypothetical protein
MMIARQNGLWGRLVQHRDDWLVVDRLDDGIGAWMNQKLEVFSFIGGSMTLSGHKCEKSNQPAIVKTL